MPTSTPLKKIVIHDLQRRAFVITLYTRTIAELASCFQQHGVEVKANDPTGDSLILFCVPNDVHMTIDEDLEFLLEGQLVIAVHPESSFSCMLPAYSGEFAYAVCSTLKPTHEFPEQRMFDHPRRLQQAAIRHYARRRNI